MSSSGLFLKLVSVIDLLLGVVKVRVGLVLFLWLWLSFLIGLVGLVVLLGVILLVVMILEVMMFVCLGVDDFLL